MNTETGQVRLTKDYLAHDDGTLYSKLEVSQGMSDKGDDSLHAVDLLAQKYVHRSQSAHLLQSTTYLNRSSIGNMTTSLISLLTTAISCSMTVEEDNVGQRLLSAKVARI